MRSVLCLLAWVSIAVLVIPGNCSTLYGYYYSTTSSGLVSIDPQTGASTVVCDLSKLPELLGASSSSYAATETLLFYTINASGDISIVEVEPSSCKTTTTLITGLTGGQNDVRDIKYDSVNNVLYMVFPNPNCLHGSLDSVNLKTGAVIAHLTNVIDPEGLGQTTGVDGKAGVYYYVAIPFGAEDVTYQLNKVNLGTGNITAINLVNNNIDVGNTWSTNFTLSVTGTASGAAVIGAISPPSSTTTKQCYPSGFYTINPVSGDVSCSFGPVPYIVYPLAEFDPSTSSYYQIFTDSHYQNFYLTTYDTQTNKVLYTVPCKMCSQLSVLAAL